MKTEQQLLEEAYLKIYLKENKQLLCESGYSEAWELILHKSPEIKKITNNIFNLGDFNEQDPKIDNFCKRLGKYIDSLPKTLLSWKEISTLKDVDQTYIKSIQNIQSKPNTRDLYIELMTKRDQEGQRPEGKLSNGVLYDIVKNNKAEPPVLMRLNSRLYAIGGRTRLYAALASQTDINTIILDTQNLQNFK